MTIEFSLRGYRQLLGHLLDGGYRCLRFDQLPPAPVRARVALLRHDVDISTDFALRLAEVEAERQVASTYFLMLGSPLYSLFSRACRADVRRIAELGHQLALHIDVAAYGMPKGAELRSRIERELATLADLIGSRVSAFSFHQPTPDVLALDVSLPETVNAYALEQSHGISYLSDSNRDWRGKDALAVIRQGVPLQLLIHPLWWVCDDPEIWNCWDAAIVRNFERQQEHLLATEGAYGPKRQLRVTQSGARPRSSSDVKAVLAPIADDDSRKLFEWINDRELVVNSAPYRPVHWPDHEAWFRDVRTRRDVAIFGIRRASDGALVGTCQLTGIDEANGSAELRIRIGDPSARGTGVGTDACRALLKHAFEDLNLRRVHLQVLGTNEPARRLYEKLGFTVDDVAKDAVFIDGRLRDVVTMSIHRAG